MSQFPADQSPAASADDRPDPFDELTRLISGEATVPVAPAPVRAQPAAFDVPSDDYDIQAAMEGRAPRPAPAAAYEPPVAAPEAPAMPSVPSFAPVLPEGVHAVPTRGPLARVAAAQADEPPAAAPAQAESPLDAVFDLSALRAAFERDAAVAAAAPSEPVPVAEPLPMPVEAAPVASEPPVRPATPPVFATPPAPHVPENELAEIVQPPAEFAERAVPEAPAPEPRAPAPAAFAPDPAPPALPEASFELDLEAELEAALMMDLEADSPAEAAPAPLAPVLADEFAEAPMGARPEPAFVAEPVIAPARPAVAHRRRRAVAATFALAMMGGAAAIAWTVIGEPRGDDVPVLLADAGPTKVRPEDAGGKAIPNRDAALFKTTSSHQSALRKSEEQPVEVALAPRRVDAPLKVKTSLKRALPPTARKVRTVVVKPDGSIVSEEKVVGAVAPRVARTVPVAAPAPVRDESTAPALVWDEPAAAPKVAAAPEAKPAVEVALAKPAEAAPVKAAPKPEPAAKPVAAAPRKVSDYVVQISSRRSAEAALRAFDTLKRRYSKVLAGRESDYQRTEIAGKGTFYRVRVLTESKSDARALCASLKRAGGSCFVTR